MTFELTRVWQLLLLIMGAFGLGFAMGTGSIPILLGASTLLVITIVTAKRATTSP